jgi:DNA-binding HxlR family transcriptional regulator
MQRRSLAEQPCPVARTLDIVGEWWTLVIVRDAFRGARRFDDFRSVGIADNILSARLKRLVDEGIFERRRYQERPERFEYVLTEKGRDLMVVLGALGIWGKKWTEGPDRTGFLHEECGHPATLVAWCEDCGRAIDRDEIRVPRLRPEELGATA